MEAHFEAGRMFGVGGRKCSGLFKILIYVTPRQSHTQRPLSPIIRNPNLTKQFHSPRPGPP